MSLRSGRLFSGSEDFAAAPLSLGLSRQLHHLRWGGGLTSGVSCSLEGSRTFSLRLASEFATERSMLGGTEGVDLRATVRVRQMCLMSFSSNSLQRGIMVSRAYDQRTRDRSSR